MVIGRAGPAGVTREKPALRRRLTVGAADDRYEREADVIADEIVANLRRSPIGAGSAGVQRHATPGAVGGEGGEVPAATASRIRPSGDRFDGTTRARMEQAFGADFSDVRVHASAAVDTAAEGLSADAFTLGRDVYVRRELYQPGTPAGDRLLAHELTHTLQQGGSKIRRSTAHVDVSADMPSRRVSTKKRMLYLDFVKMKRYDPKYGKAIKQALGMDVDDDSMGGTWGHWWTEVGARDPDTGVFTPDKSYGWWPNGGAGGVTGALAGVPGILNNGGGRDPHHGETGEAGLTEFHPAMNLDTGGGETYDQIKTRVLNDIDTFARGYSGKWQWKLGWGQNCHTFQQAMKTKVKMHYQAAKGWLEDPSIRQAKLQAAQSASANLARVAKATWFVCQNAAFGTMNPTNEEEGPELKLSATKEFAPVGQARRIGGMYCREVITRDGLSGWVTEFELQHFTNM
jgi:hypothetical protein